MIVLGISAFYHDSAAAIVRDGAILAAAQEERFSRRKADSDFPAKSIDYCLDVAGMDLAAVDRIVFYDKPLLTFNRLLETYISYAPLGLASFVHAMPVWIKEKIFQKSLLHSELNKLGRGTIPEEKILFDFHHHSHAASAFYPSPFDEAAILVMDGVGDWATTSMGVGRGNDVKLTHELRFPHSLGMLYSAFTYYLGFKVNDGEYKVMGLAPYGEPRFVDTIYKHLIDLREDGSYRLDMSYFDYCTGLRMTNDKFARLFGAPRRDAEAPLEQRHMDLARSIQAVTEEIMLRIARHLHASTGQKNLCLAGGVALNCVSNGRLLREGPFENIWIQPAAGDAGGALGAALAVAHVADGAAPRTRPTARDGMSGCYLGPSYDAARIQADLDRVGAKYDVVADDKLFDVIGKDLADGRIVGWFQGRMEFGPRSLGSRSILADARSPAMQRVLNLKIKYRESFRPFAPAVLREDVTDYFDLDCDSPYMLLVDQVKESIRKPSDPSRAYAGLDKLHEIRSDIPAVTHVDYSARIQTVHRDTNPRFALLLEAFKRVTGSGVLVNTSFNVRDEPIVCSPEDAYRCFMGSEIDILVLENFVLYKSAQ